MADTTFTPGTLITSDWLNDVNDAVYGAGGVINANTVIVTPAGNISSTDVQAALEELDTEKQPLDSDLTAIAALTTTSYGRSLLEVASEAALKALINLEIGTDVQEYNANTIAVAPGTSGKVLTSNGSSWVSSTPTLPVLPGSYVRQTISPCPAAGALGQAAHGFGTTPIFWKIYLQCIAAGGEAGWAQNDIVDVSNAANDNYNWVSYADSTNVNIRLGSLGAWVLNKTTGVATAITESNWALIVDVWK